MAGVRPLAPGARLRWLTGLTGLVVGVALTGAGLAGAGCRVDDRSTPRSNEAGPLISVTGPELVERVRARDADYVLVNVWATWCGPCIEEFPYIQRITRSFADRGVDLVFVSTDFDTERDAALEFLRAQGADLPSYIKSGDDQDFINALYPEWSGAMPFTVIFDREGRRVKVWPGKVEAAELQQTLQELVGAADR